VPSIACRELGVYCMAASDEAHAATAHLQCEEQLEPPSSADKGSAGGSGTCSTGTAALGFPGRGSANEPVGIRMMLNTVHVSAGSNSAAPAPAPNTLLPGNDSTATEEPEPGSNNSRSAAAQHQVAPTAGGPPAAVVVGGVPSFVLTSALTPNTCAHCKAGSTSGCWRRGWAIPGSNAFANCEWLTL
jgi:hypothetical protein